MISSPSFEKPPVLISLRDPRDCWFDFGGAAPEALEAAADGCLAADGCWLFALRWLAATPDWAALLFGAIEGGLEA